LYNKNLYFLYNMTPLDYATLIAQAIVTIGGLFASIFSAKQTPAEQAAADAEVDARLEMQARADVAGGNLATIQKDAAP
jgi:hypothetical protein